MARQVVILLNTHHLRLLVAAFVVLAMMLVFAVIAQAIHK